MKKIFVLAILAAVASGAEGYKVLSKIKVGGTGGWDYLTLDPVNRRLYVSHGPFVEVLDPDKGTVVGKIGDLHGVHGIAVAPDLGKGFITNGQSNSVTVFDLKTLAKMGEPATGRNPDAVCYEPKTKRVYSINHTGNDVTAIDPKNNEVLKTFPVGPAPEFCVVDGAGKVYVNIEGSSEIVEIDAARNEVTRRVSLAPSEAPTGLAIDVKNRKLFAACGGSKTMAVVDIPSFKVIAAPAIGVGTDGAGFDPGLGLAFSSNTDGTLSIVKLVNGKYETVDTVTTARGGRTMTVDEKMHRVYVPAAEFGPVPEPKDGKKGRAPVLPDSFGVLVIGKQ